MLFGHIRPVPSPMKTSLFMLYCSCFPGSVYVHLFYFDLSDCLICQIIIVATVEASLMNSKSSMHWALKKDTRADIDVEVSGEKDKL